MAQTLYVYPSYVLFKGIASYKFVLKSKPRYHQQILEISMLHFMRIIFDFLYISIYFKV